MSQSKANKKVANNLVVMSSAAVLAVYSAGYVRTRPAANRFAVEAAERPPAREFQPKEAEPQANIPPAAPNRPAVEPSRAPANHSEPKREGVVTATRVSPAPSKATEPAPTVENAPAPVETAPTAASVAAPAATSFAAPAVASVAAPASSVATVSPAAQPQTDAPATAPVPPAPPVWKDGKYTAWGTCRHGDIQATVVIEGGKIISAAITDCQTRYSCDVIENLPAKVIARQKNKIDTVGGATESAYAYYGAVYWALDQASK